jgi:hypothetical protein
MGPRGKVAADLAWANQFMPFIRAVVGPCLLGPSTLQEDTQENTDLRVLIARDMRIACRVRAQKYRELYGDEFTFRVRRDTGAEAEFNKMLEGWGDWFFYGFATECAELAIDPWWIINLEVFRSQYRQRLDLRQVRERANGDGTFFLPFKFSSFCGVSKFLIWSSEQRRQQRRRQQRCKPLAAASPDAPPERSCDRCGSAIYPSEEWFVTNGRVECYPCHYDDEERL